MKTVKEVIEFIERERTTAEKNGYSYTASALGELKEKIEGAVCAEANNPSPADAGAQRVACNSTQGSLEELSVKIGDEVYSVLMPMIPELDGPAKVSSWEVRGVGVFKDGTFFAVNNDGEVYKLDDEKEGLSFSTRERAEAFLKKMQGEGHDEV